MVRGWRDSVVAVSKGQGYAGSKLNSSPFAGENREAIVSRFRPGALSE